MRSSPMVRATLVPKGRFVTPTIITRSSGFMVFRIFGRGFLNLLGSDCRRDEEGGMGRRDGGRRDGCIN